MQASKRSKADGLWAVDLPVIDDSVVSLYVKTEESADLLCKTLTDHVVDAYVIPTNTAKTQPG
jgi:hypothetical protein